MENYTVTTLVVKHLPEFITQSVEIRNAYFKKYKPIDVRFMDSPAMIGFAFLDFSDRPTAEKAYEDLKLINFGLYYKQIKVEYAKPDPNKPFHYQRPPEPTIDQQEKSVEPISKTLGLLYPSNPHLKYYYPDPTPDILTNMMHAIRSVPRLYTQVLHLMNKLNMQPPFGPLEKDAIPNVLKRKRDALLASDESELEDDAEEDTEDQIKIQEEKVKQARLARLAAEKQKLALQKSRKVVASTPTTSSTLKSKCKPLSELADLPAFKNYQPGNPSAKLYIKNLSKKATQEELHAIYSNFTKDITVNLMTKGRLRDQAFVSFPDVKTATTALENTNGYMLHERPMAVHFGRESSS